MAREQIWAKALQKSNRWIKELCEDLGWTSKQDALLALRSVLHALRDRLTPDEAAQLAGQLPLLIKGVYYDGWDPSRTPLRVRTKEEFLELMRPTLERGIPRVDLEQVTQAVIRLIENHVSEGEMEDVRSVLPKDLLELWPSEAAAHTTP